MSPVVRPASTGDGPALQEIERLAGERFREVGLSTVADNEPFPVEVLARYAAAGRSWVAVSDEADPIGYVLVDVVDGNANIEQLSVRPDHQAAGVGRALLRIAGYFVSLLALGGGFLMIGFTGSRRGLHDVIAGTYVARRD